MPGKSNQHFRSKWFIASQSTKQQNVQLLIVFTVFYFVTNVYLEYILRVSGLPQFISVRNFRVGTKSEEYKIIFDKVYYELSWIVEKI